MVYVTPRAPTAGRRNPTLAAPASRQGAFVPPSQPAPPLRPFTPAVDIAPTLTYRASDPNFELRVLHDRVRTLDSELAVARETARIRDEQLERQEYRHVGEVRVYEAKIMELQAAIAELQRNQRPPRGQGSRRGD